MATSASAKGRYYTADATVSAYGATAVTPDDTTIIPVTRGLYVGAGGDVAVRMWRGETVTFVGVVTGTILPLQVDMVLATNTGATSIVALY